MRNDLSLECDVEINNNNEYNVNNNMVMATGNFYDYIAKTITYETSAGYSRF